jgi:hypothetical protein
MPRGVYTRQHARLKPDPIPLAVPPMPPRKGRWRAATEHAWASWFESGRASLLDEAGIAALGRLMKLIDKAEVDDWPLGLTREVRLQEAAILRQAQAEPASFKAPPTTDERTARREAFRGGHLLKRQAEREHLGTTEDEFALHEMSALAG